MVFQSFYLIPELDAEQNVLMASRIIRSPGAAERTRARELIARVGLADRATHLPCSFPAASGNASRWRAPS
jgi:lipoprotein-releasing system ATP-binding protein